MRSGVLRSRGALASLTFKVDAARNLLAQDSARAETLLAEVRQQAQEAITDIRRLVYNLRPPALDEFGLLLALRDAVGGTLPAPGTRGGL